jgi:hypothetical protein
MSGITGSQVGTLNTTGGSPVDSNDDLMELMFGPELRPAPRHKRKKPEAGIQREIIRWLICRGALLAVTDAGLLKKMGIPMSCGIPKGWPDLTCCTPNGTFLGIECKAPGEKQTEHQVSWQHRIEENNGIYIVACSVQDVKDALIKLECSGNHSGIHLDD